jgi:hypothetical protein
MSLIPEPPLPEQPELVEQVGPAGGPTYRYRGASIRCQPGGHVCRLLMASHPLDGIFFGVVGTITPLIDLWEDHRKLPNYMKVARKD